MELIIKCFFKVPYILNIITFACLEQLRFYQIIIKNTENH